MFQGSETDGEKKETERQIQRENTHHKPQGIVKTVKKRERLRGKALPSLLCTASINNALGETNTPPPSQLYIFGSLRLHCGPHSGKKTSRKKHTAKSKL